MQLTDLIDRAALNQNVAEGYVTVREHPEFPELRIANYTDRCAFDQHWTKTTRQTRGLIWNEETGEILARPLAKFFNYGDETHTGHLDPDMRIVSAHDKIDGSLGIGYVAPDGTARIATRGSFVSEQALHATARIDSVIRGSIFTDHERGFTPLWEIVYPENRIVIDYGDRDELVYLGAVLNGSGSFYAAKTSDDGFLEVDQATLRDVLEREPRKNAEGYVIWLKYDQAIKLKQDDYVALHRIVSHLTEKEVWRQLRDGTFQEYAEALPDEFHEWARTTSAPLVLAYDSYVAALTTYHKCVPEGDRKTQALWIKDTVPPKLQGMVFSLLDGKDPTDKIWRVLEPKGAVPA